MDEQLYENSIKNRCLFVWGEIEDKLAYDVLQAMNFFASVDHTPIYLIIHSGGGNTESESVIVDEMIALKSKMKIYTIAVGMAYSAASTILTLGTKGCRYARPNASIMLHPASISIEEDYESHQKNMLDFFIKKSDRTNLLVAEACGMQKKYSKFQQDIDKGLWLSPEEAIKYGAIDHIWTAPLPIGGTKHANRDKQ